MEISYNHKIIKSGKHLEVYIYKDKEMKRGFKRGRRILRPGDKYSKKDTKQIRDSLGEEGYAMYKKYEGKYKVNEEEEVNMLNEDRLAQAEEDDKKQKAKSSLKRTRNTIRRLINSNPELRTFLTLTFGKSMTDIKKANNIFNLFAKRMGSNFKGFKYLAVIEFQNDTDFHGRKKEKGGSIHYHLLCNLEIPKFKTEQEQFAFERMFFKKHWKKNGFVKIKEVDQVDNMGAYFSKYLGKDIFDERMFRKRKFFCSQNLKRPDELFNQESKDFLKKNVDVDNPLFEKSFTTEWAGNIEYKSYKVDEEKLALLTKNAVKR